MFAKWTNIAPTACFDVSKNLQKQVYRYDKPFLKYCKCMYRQDTVYP